MTSDAYQQKLAHLLACGVPELEAEVVARGAADNPTTLAVRDFSAGPLTFCLVLGGAGSGKTIAVSEALLNARLAWDGGKSWCYSSSEARFHLAGDLARLSYYGGDATRTLDKAERVPWLVLDDIGSEFVADIWRSNFSELIATRNSGKRKTLITSNLSVEDFKAKYDARIISRIRGKGVVIISGTTDLRRSA